MTKSEFATLLGAPEHEVLDVVETAVGEIAHMFDGSSYIKTVEGDLKLVLHEGQRWTGAFPVFELTLEDLDLVHPAVPAIPAESAPVEVPAPPTGFTEEPPAAPAAPEVPVEATTTEATTTEATTTTEPPAAAAAETPAPAVPVKGAPAAS